MDRAHGLGLVEDYLGYRISRLLWAHGMGFNWPLVQKSTQLGVIEGRFLGDGRQL